ncbi:MAG: hypothetical protein M1358_24190 [Chloroflexi bacterium]|nr:hypothetical protein [Chloroflexota bacterium]
MFDLAESVLLRNSRRGIIGTGGNTKEYFYVCPAKVIYPHQWLWDSCFHAIVMARFDGRLAQAELRTLVTQIRENGFLPHIVSWKDGGLIPLLDELMERFAKSSHHANLTQPPVLGIAVEEVYGRTGDREFLSDLLPALKLYYRYFASQRDPDGDGLVSIIFPIESGMDHSPVYDAILDVKRPIALAYHLANLKLSVEYLRLGWDLERIFAADRFSVEDLAFNCIYAYGLRATARLCDELDDDEAPGFRLMAEKVEQAIVDKCYNKADGIFYSLYSKNDAQVPVKTVASLLPLILEDVPDSVLRTLVEKYLLNPQHFWTPYPVASVSLSEPQFASASAPLRENDGLLGRLRRQYEKYHLVWRGPTWVNMNWFLSRGLRRHGYGDVADELTAKTVGMIQKAGFWEFYNPITGDGQGAEHFSWSTLVVDMVEDAGGRVSRRVVDVQEPLAADLTGPLRQPSPASP